MNGGYGAQHWLEGGCTCKEFKGKMVVCNRIAGRNEVDGRTSLEVQFSAGTLQIRSIDFVWGDHSRPKFDQQMANVYGGVKSTF